PSSCFDSSRHQVTVASNAPEDSHQHLISPSQVNYHNNGGHAIRYYQPLMEHYGGGPLNRYSSLNQKRESVITFSSNTTGAGGLSHSALKHAYLDSLDLEEDKPCIGSV